MRKRQNLNPEDELPEEPIVNLTPLIDVVFVVLISFILIAPILEIDSVRLAEGISSNNKESPSIQNSPFSISIRKDNSIWLQGRKLNLAELKKELLIRKKERPKETPQVVPDAEAHFETYCQVKNILEACGFEQMDILLRPA